MQVVRAVLWMLLLYSSAMFCYTFYQDCHHDQARDNGRVHGTLR